MTAQQLIQKAKAVVRKAKDEEATALRSVACVAKLLEVHENTVRTWIQMGRISAIRHTKRGQFRIHKDEVQRLKDSRYDHAK